MYTNRFPYPVIIVADRYSGTYSGAKWVAFHEYEIPDGPQDGDIECAEFWRDYDKIYGLGATPQAAYENLLEKLSEGDWP